MRRLIRWLFRFSARFPDGRMVLRHVGGFALIDYAPTVRNAAINQRINESANKCIRESLMRPMNPSRHQPITDSINQAMHQSMNASINRLIISQSMNPCIRESIHRSTRRRINQCILKSTNYWMNEWMNEWVNQCIIQLAAHQWVINESVNKPSIIHAINESFSHSTISLIGWLLYRYTDVLIYWLGGGLLPRIVDLFFYLRFGRFVDSPIRLSGDSWEGSSIRWPTQPPVQRLKNSLPRWFIHFRRSSHRVARFYGESADWFDDWLSSNLRINQLIHKSMNPRVEGSIN